ncbi:hypothetical protein D0Y65_041867 [Glycine soja]|uniref:Ubiquitin-like protease family profile domain-containing protein n=1 Tax=Glycine soja TaxID=3848 RepID=A0A445GXK4_GLYSO|nr:hypothetical protein D0Y65_041867 [Glycine soja]
MFLIFNTSALKGLDDTPQPKSKAAARWIVVKCNRQKGITECGYYVVHWMSTIILGSFRNNWETYFNEVRPLEAERFKALCIQWAQYYLKKKLQDSTTSAEQAFKLLLGKENFGRVRCFGRIVTPSHLKRKEEIVALKKEPANEWNNWARRFEGLEALLICFMKQNNSNLDDEALDDMIRNVVANENSNAAM